MKKFSTLLFCIAFIGLFSLVCVCKLNAQTSATFTRDLKLGITSSEVKELQILLNNDPETRIASSGSGSPGNETSYFGAKTHAAVVRFQNKYRQEVLTPSGLSLGTGFVGKATRAKLNTMASNKGITPVAPTNTPSNTGSVSFKPVDGSQKVLPATIAAPTADEIRLYSALPYQIAPGQKLTFSGVGFKKDDMANFGSQHSASITLLNTEGTKAEVTIPSNVPHGSLAVSVSRNGKTSQYQGYPVNILVTANPAQSPVVVSVSPQVISSLDTLITVTGSGFTSKNNVYTAFGSITSASSNTTSFTFKPSDFPDAAKLKSVLSTKPTGYELKVDFYVINDNGMTQQSSSFNVQ